MVGLVLLLTPAPAQATTCPTPPWGSPTLGAESAERRVAFVRERLLSGRSAASTWSWTWGITNGALAAGQLAALPFTSDRGERVLLAAGAAISTAAVAQITLLPIVPGRPEPASPPPHGDATSLCAALASDERTLERAARNTGLVSGAMAQIANLAVNAGFGVAVGLHHHSAWAGALTFGIGWGIGEAQILTVPSGIARDFARYREGHLEPATTRGPVLRLVRVAGGGALVLALAY